MKRSTAFLHLVASALLFTAGAPPFQLTARGQTTPAAHHQNSPPRQEAPPAQWTGPLGQWRATLVPMLMHDFGERYLYGPADRTLPPPAIGERRVVFMGDSITDLWHLEQSFPGRPYVNRGVGGQVTSQMVLRFHQDVLALHPAVVFILGGVNDISGVLQVESDGGIEANYQAMAEMARAHGIRVVFASLTPLNNYTDNARTLLQDRPPARLAALNRWLQRYSQACGLRFADLRGPLTDASGMMRREFTHDGLHPDTAGYAAIAPLAEAAIGRALAAPPPSARVSPACAAVTPDP